MSLVNDMLRDLDSRRRTTPGSGVGSEKLIPASEFNDRKGRGFSVGRLVVPVLLVLVVLLAAAALFMLNGREAMRAPINVPVATATQLDANTAAARSEMEAAMLAEMERMALRMQELEERAAVLQEEVIQSSVGQVESPQLSSGPPIRSSDGNATGYAEVAEWSPRESSTAASYPSVPASALAQTEPQHVIASSILPPDAAAVSTLVRNPSELTFSEADRLQVQEALQQWQSGQRNGALQMLTQFSAQNLEAHQSREMLAKLLMQQGDSIGALEHADIGLRISPDHGGYKKVKARVLMTAGVPGDAADLLGTLPPSLASDTEYHELLAASMLASERYEEALLSYQSLTSNDPAQSRWWYGVAASMDALGRSFEAAQTYERAVELGGLSSNLMQQSQQRIVAIRQN